MKKIIFSAILLAGLYGFAQSKDASVSAPITLSSLKPKLSEGTVIKVALSEDLNGKNLSKGQKINFTTSGDIIVGDRVVVKEGLKVTGTITEAAKSGMLAKRGKLAFSIDYLYLPDGKVVKLTSDVSKAVKSSTGVVVATAVLLSPLALFIGGKNAKYKEGEVFEAYVKEDYTF
jgi:predicted RecA/RadA family phage recombinase